MTMRCVDEGQLRAYLDGEVSEAEEAVIAAHLGDCAACDRRCQELAEGALATSTVLAAWLPAPAGDQTSADDERRASAALARFQATIREDARDNGVARGSWFDQLKEQMTQMMKRLTAPRLRPALSAIAAVAILAIAFTVTPVASLADQLTKTFRVQQFAAIAVHVPGMTSLPQPQSVDPAQLDQLRQMLAPLGTPTTNITHDTARQVADVAAAQAFLAQHGATLQVPGKVPTAFDGKTAQYGVADPTSSTYVLNVAVAKQYLSMLNSPELSALPWPNGVDQLTFGLDTPAAAVSVYGDQTQGFGILQMANLPNSGPGAGPALHLPDELDVNAFRTALLALPGLPQDTVNQVKNVQDWDRTLIIPVPEDATTKNVSIKGNAGLLIVDGQGRGSVVIWQADGQLFAVGGTLSEADILSIANNLTNAH
jgi:anti-sigma factor RsiW